MVAPDDDGAFELARRDHFVEREPKLVALAETHPRVRNVTPMSNSIFNAWRFEDAWLDQ